MKIVVNEGIQLGIGYGIFLFCIAIFSVILNSLVIWVSFTRDKRKRAADSQLIFLIALFDICIGIFIIISQVIEWTSPSALQFRGGSWCIFSSIFYDSFTVIAICLTSQLSIIRYLAIVKSYTIRNIRSIIASIIIILVILVIFTVSTIKGVSKLMPSGVYCIPVHMHPGSIGDIIYSISIMIILTPNVLIIPICYAMVSFHYRKVALRLQVGLAKVINKPFYKKYGFILALVFIILAYLTSILPELVIVGFESSNDSTLVRTGTLDRISFCLLFCVTIINPLFVLTLHQESRDELLSKVSNRYYISNLNIDLR